MIELFVCHLKQHQIATENMVQQEGAYILHILHILHGLTSKESFNFTDKFYSKRQDKTPNWEFAICLTIKLYDISR